MHLCVCDHVHARVCVLSSFSAAERISEMGQQAPESSIFPGAQELAQPYSRLDETISCQLYSTTPTQYLQPSLQSRPSAPLNSEMLFPNRHRLSCPRAWNECSFHVCSSSAYLQPDWLRSSQISAFLFSKAKFTLLVNIILVYSDQWHLYTSPTSLHPTLTLLSLFPAVNLILE